MTTLTNASVFDGHSADLLRGQTVVIQGGRIASVSAAPPVPGAPVIDCGGRTLMPGLIDAHSDPTRDVNVLAADGRNLRLVMRAGEIVRNELSK